MKIIKITTFATLVFTSFAAQAGQPIINLNIGGELAPGIYGEVQFGNAPPPPVVYAQPRVIVRPPRGRVVEPMYLHVPPGHAKNWRKHCRKYGACGRSVYFVRSQEYEPGYRSGRGRGRSHDGHEYRAERHDEHGNRGDGHDHDEGNRREEHRGGKHGD